MTEKIHCDYCGQGALADDTHCWQCGRPLPVADAPVLALPAAEGAPAGERYWSMTTVYTLLTIFVALLALAAIFLLGRQPKVQATSWAVDKDFQLIVGGDGGFTVALPTSWQGYDAAVPAEATLLEEKLAGGLDAALLPWPELAADLKVVLLAEAPSIDGRAGAFLLIAQTAALAGEEPEIIAEALRRREAIGADLEVAEDFERTHLRIPRRIAALAERDECEQWLHPGRRQTLLAVFCAPEFGAGRVHREAIRASLQNFR